MVDTLDAPTRCPQCGCQWLPRNTDGDRHCILCGTVIGGGRQPTVADKRSAMNPPRRYPK